MAHLNGVQYDPPVTENIARTDSATTDTPTADTPPADTVSETSMSQSTVTGGPVSRGTGGRAGARDMAIIAVFAAITAALGLLPAIYLPISPVPITAQTFGVILAGAIIGGRRAAASQLLYLALAAIGLPILAGGHGGIGAFVGPTIGFLVAFPVVAGLIGWATERVGAPYRLVAGLVINAVFGIGVMYLLGWAGLMGVTHLGPVPAIVALAPFLVGDAIKVVLATVTAKGVHASYPGLLPRRGVRVAPAAGDPA